MEVVQGKSTNKKVVIAQEIAFAKVLAGNNKTLRDRAVKKLKKWLTLRGNGKWAFTEDEFIRLWTGLFYCMWMSDKFLVQEELAESISQLIHCFKKNSENALLFIKCFNKRLLMEWEGLDQYRIDKFNMLVRRFLRQTFTYCKAKDWEESILSKLMDIFYNIVLHRDNCLGFVLHFISIYAEELAKVSKGKIEHNKVLIVIEPFIKLIARAEDVRIKKEAEEFFYYLMRQTDAGIDFEEKFNAWKEQGFPGQGPHCLKKIEIPNQRDTAIMDSNDSYSEEENEALDPRAGNVHVFLPQIPLDIDGIINLFKKYEFEKETNSRGRKILRTLIQKFMVLKRGKFPQTIKKDLILEKKTKKRNQTKKNAKKLYEFTHKLDKGPIKTKEFEDINKELEDQSENSDDLNEIETKKDYIMNNDNQEKLEVEKEKKIKPNKAVKNNLKNKFDEEAKFNLEKKIIKRNENINGTQQAKIKNKKEISFSNDVENKKIKLAKAKVNKFEKKRKKKGKNKELFIRGDDKMEKGIKMQNSLNGITNSQNSYLVDKKNVTFSQKVGIKRKILSNWQVQKLDTSSPDYYKIETPKIIRIEKKLNETYRFEENQEPKKVEGNEKDNEWKNEKETKEIYPVFWEKARAKVNKKHPKKANSFMNPFAVNGEAKSPALRKISFALDKNMAQENEEYLEEVKNSPKVPFDGSKKPVQSALKSGLSPTPINPFYRFKRIKF